MEALSKEQQAFIIDLLKSEGWRIMEKIGKEDIENYRRLATQKTTPLEDRLWYSALAEGREEALQRPQGMVEYNQDEL